MTPQYALGRFTFGGHGVTENTHNVHFDDPNTRRTIAVTLPNPNGYAAPDGDPDFVVPGNKAADALTRHLDDLPPETVAIIIDETGKLLSFCTDPKEDCTGIITDYFLVEAYQLPPPIPSKTVLRSELTELRRYTTGVDLVSYPTSLSPPADREDKNRYVFKYGIASTILWKEIQMLARLPPHPNMALLDRLVLDETTGSQVVGFTVRYVAAKTLMESRSRFKLKWLKQLIHAVDDLNLKHGIIHQDIADRNLLIDPHTDSIVLIDFDFASRIGVRKTNSQGPEGERPERDDIKGVLVFLYEHITRDPVLNEYVLHNVDEKDFEDPAKWIKHPDVQLDGDVDEFYAELMAWVSRRRAGEAIAHYSEAPEPLEWPSLSEKVWRRMRNTIGGRHMDKLPYLEWKRPASSKLDPTRRLLATGRYADEEEAAQRAAVAALKAAAGAGTLDPSATSSDEATAAKSVGSSGRGKRATKLNNSGDPSATAAALDGAGKAASNKARRKRRQRAKQQATPSKEIQGGGGADTGPAKRRSKRLESRALSSRA